MNYLFLIGLLIFGSSCTDYSPLGGNGSEQESKMFYLELDFHQESLAYEDSQLRNERLIILQQIENGNNEGQGRLEFIQNRLQVIEENMAWNSDVFAGGVIGPGGRPPRCDFGPDPGVMRPCPMPRLALENLYLANEQWGHTLEEIGDIQVFNEDGELVGRMEGVSEVPNTDGLYVKAEIEYDIDSAYEVRVTNLDVREELRTTVYRLQ